MIPEAEDKVLVTVSPSVTARAQASSADVALLGRHRVSSDTRSTLIGLPFIADETERAVVEPQRSEYFEW
jgi:hypothetical protein